MNMCQDIPEPLAYLLALYPVLVLTRPILPANLRGPAGKLLSVLDGIVGNFGNCKNAKPEDRQGRISTKPQVPKRGR